jgi:hypothetical protein
MDVLKAIVTYFVPLLSLLISASALAFTYLNWRVKTVRLRFCKTSQWRNTAVNSAGTVEIMINLENYGDEGFKVLKISRLHFSADSEPLPPPEVLELEMECYGKETFCAYSIPLIPDGITTYIIAIRVVYKSLETFLGINCLPFSMKSKLFLFECSPGYISQVRSTLNQDQPLLSEIVEKSKRLSVMKRLPKEFN